MPFSILKKPKQKFIGWLSHEPPQDSSPLCNFERIQYELRPCDVILTEGRSRVSEVIKSITQSAWSHSALYIGRLHDIDNPVLRDRIRTFFRGSPEEQMLIESVLGKGTVITPLTRYRDFHIRICRPKGISRQDAQRVIGFAIARLGKDYDIRHNVDLARFLLPWSIFPRRWRSSLFVNNPTEQNKEICSSMLAEAFSSVQFPILPIVRSDKEKGLQLYRRNPRLYTPRDFDYSPYFEIIKYPFFEISDHPVYRNLPWNEEVIGEDEVVPQESKK